MTANPEDPLNDEILPKNWAFLTEVLEPDVLDDWLESTRILDFADPPPPKPPTPNPNLPHKICSNCDRSKPISEFHRANRPTPDGLSHHCKTCHTLFNGDHLHKPHRPKRK